MDILEICKNVLLCFFCLIYISIGLIYAETFSDYIDSKTIKYCPNCSYCLLKGD